MHHSPNNNKTKNWQFIHTCTCELTVCAQPPYLSMCSIPSKMLRTHFSTLCDSKRLSFVSLSCIDPLFSPHRWIGKLKKNPSLLWKVFSSFWWHSETHQLVGIAKYMYDITDWQQCKCYNVHSQNKTKVLLASCNSTLTGRVVHHTCIRILPILGNNRHTL